jgi:hypothetical protein
MGVSGNISAQVAQAAQKETVDPERPWLTMPKQDGGTGGLFGGKPQAEQRPLFSPMKTEDLVKLSAEDRNAYFADYAKYGNSLSGLRLMGAPGGGIMGSPGGGLMGIGQLMGAAQSSLENQRQALNDLLYPRAPGGFLPRAIQPQRTPNAPGAR